MTVKDKAVVKDTKHKITKDDSSSEFLRKPSFYNKWRGFFQYLVTHVGYQIFFKIMYRLEVYGKENLPTESDYIIAANHLSTLDPPLVCGIVNKSVAYMAKKELFDNVFLRWWLNWLGAFAVDREKLGFSTVKTVMSIKQTGWVLGIFPQGKRQEPGIISDVTKGFATIAKKKKCGILPIGIIGTDKKAKFPFSGKVVAKIGKLIPYSDDIQEMVDAWGTAVQELTGYKYISTEK